MIKAGVAGLGWWGKTLVEAVADGSDEIEFVAATTRSLSSDAQAFCKDQGLELLPNYEAMLDDPGIDAVVLATPHSLHVPQVVAAAAAGKHVFCEKPFALDKAGAKAAVAAMEKAGLTLGLGYNRGSIRQSPICASASAPARWARSFISRARCAFRTRSTSSPMPGAPAARRRRAAASRQWAFTSSTG